MKLSLTVLILVICFALMANAETKFGIQAGGNIGKFNVENSAWQTGYSIGAVTEFILDNSIFIEFGINLVRKGGILNNIVLRGENLNLDRDVYEKDVEIMLSSIEIPFICIYKFPIAKRFSLAPMAGISCSIPFSATTTSTLKKFLYYYTGNNNDPNRLHYENLQYISIEGSLNPSTLYALLIGVGASYSNYSIKLLYCYDINSIENVNSIKGINEKLRHFTFSISYLF